jgi:hypothetical protein
VSYIDAGYAIALAVLTGYAGQLWQRRRRLERLVARSWSTATGATPTDPMARSDGAPSDAPADDPNAPADGNTAATLTETRVGA